VFDLSEEKNRAGFYFINIFVWQNDNDKERTRIKSQCDSGQAGISKDRRFNGFYIQKTPELSEESRGFFLRFWKNEFFMSEVSPHDHNYSEIPIASGTFTE